MSRDLNIKKQVNNHTAADSLRSPSQSAPLKTPAETGGEEPKLFYEDGWSDMDQRVASDTLQNDPVTNKQHDATQTELPAATLEISASVGKGGVNKPEDTEKIRAKMEELGLLQPGGDLISAITEFQSYIMKSGVPDGRVDAGGYTLRMLQQADAAGVELMKKEKKQRDEEKRKAEEKAKKDAQLKAEADKNKEKLNAQKKAETISKAGALIKKHTNMGGLNLNEEGLGSELAGLALTEPAVILAVLQQLEWEDRDDVSSAIVDKLGKKLAQLDKIVLRRLLHELDEGMTTSTEEFQMRLIKIVLGVEEKEGAASIKEVAGSEIWKTQMKNTTEVSIQCFDACKLMLESFNKENGKDLKIGARTDILKLATENTETGSYKVQGSSSTAIKYLDEQLVKGHPVIVGVSHTVYSLKKAYNEGTTDHFVVIVAKGSGTYTVDGKSTETEYYQFLDPGTFDVKKGASAENRLYLDPQTDLWRGNRKGRTGAEYILTQVRPFTVDHTRFKAEFEQAAADYNAWETKRKQAKE